jgi:hypothetical protein
VPSFQACVWAGVSAPPAPITSTSIAPSGAVTLALVAVAPAPVAPPDPPGCVAWSAPVNETAPGCVPAAPLNVMTTLFVPDAGLINPHNSDPFTPTLRLIRVIAAPA